MGRGAWLDKLTHDTVVVHLKDFDPSLKGVLAGVHADCLILRDPIVLNEKGDSPLGNTTAIVLRESVVFMEVVG